MRRDVPAALLTAAQQAVRSPMVIARVSNPLRPEPYLDLTPYIKNLEIQYPPTLKAGLCRITCTNPNKIISLSGFFKADYELNVFLGYRVPSYGMLFTKVGRFFLDSPQFTFSLGGSASGTASANANLINEVTFQARDGYKLLAERHFHSGEVYDFGSLTMRQAFQKLSTLVTVGGAPLKINFDTDEPTQQALDVNLVQKTAGPTDPAKTALSFLKDIIGNLGFIVFFDHNGELSVGLKNSTFPPAAVIGGVQRVSRPIYNRSVLRSSLETGNHVFVQGNTDFAEIEDKANIADTGRDKYIYIDDPTLMTAQDCLIRANQALDLTLRFREQPDLVMPWFPDLQRRDIIELDDASFLGLDHGFYRIEDIRYTYQTSSNQGGTSASAQPSALMELGMGIPGGIDLQSSSGTSLPSQG